VLVEIPKTFHETYFSGEGTSVLQVFDFVKLTRVLVLWQFKFKEPLVTDFWCEKNTKTKNISTSSFGYLKKSENL
jgi:hypothetical protein